jgi:putative transposase
MSHSFNKLYVHAIWSTKDRSPLIIPSIEKQLFAFIAKQFNESGCPVCIINGMPDHIHCLYLQNPKRSVSDIVKQIKGSSSYYINAHVGLNEKFAWQTGYAAFSVSESLVEKVIKYIANQKRHHKKLTFENEYMEFLKLHHLQ